jgi:choline kinase
VNRYAEDALNLIMPKLGITPVDARGYFCMELDTTQDLAVIEKYSAAQTG